MSFYEDYKPIRNKIRNYNSKELINASILLLHDSSKKPVNDWKYYMPWQILLLLKWTLSEYTSIKKPHTLNQQSFNNLILDLQKIFESHKSDTLSLYSEYQLPKFLRQTAFQQFWLQPAGRITSETLARQLKLFLPESSDKSTKIDNLFYEKTGISIGSFFEISFMILAKFLDKKNSEIFFTRDYFNEFAHSFTDNEIESYFNLLSLSFDEAKVRALEDLKVKKDTLELQIVEQSPFTFYPFLKENDKFILQTPALLHYAIRYYVYDYLKKEYGSAFSEVFSKHFENYLEIGITYSGAKYTKEDNIKKLLPKNNQVVDFFIEQEDCLILIEAKAVEMYDLAKAKQDNDILIRDLNNKIIKGVKQSYHVAKNFQNKKKIYSIIVTYKELFLGGAGRIWNEFLGEALEDFFRDQNIDRNLISQDNIYILSVDDFDLLMKAIKIDRSNLLKILDHATKMDKYVTAGKLLLGDHIKEFLPENNSNDLPPYLSETFNSFNGGMLKRFTKI